MFTRFTLLKVNAQGAHAKVDGNKSIIEDMKD